MGAVVAAGLVVADDDAGAGVGGVDHGAGDGVDDHGDVGDWVEPGVAGVGVEEEQVSGLGLGERYELDVPAVEVLLVADLHRPVEAGLPVRGVGEGGAVPSVRAVSGRDVRVTDVGERPRQRALGQVSCGWHCHGELLARERTR